VLSLALALLLPPQLGGEITGVSPETAGLAGAGVPASTDPLDASRNPAVLPWMFSGPDDAFTRRRAARGRDRLSLALRELANDLTIATHGGAELDPDTPAALAPFLGYAHDLGDGVVVGLAVWPSAGGESDVIRRTYLDIVTVNPDGTGGPAPYDVRDRWRLLQFSVEPSVAWRAGSQWTFGAGLALRQTTVDMQSATELQLDVLQGVIDEGLQPIFGAIGWGELIQQLGSERGVDSFQVDFSGDLDHGSDPMALLRFGVGWRPDPRTRVGFWYRPPSSAADLTGRVAVDMGADLGAFVDGIEDIVGSELLADPTSGYDMRISGVRMPQQLGLGVSHLLDGGRRLHFGAFWSDWSSSFSGWVAELTNPSNPEFVTFLGGDGSTTVDLGLDWRDSWALSTGLEQDFGDLWTLRGGIGWQRQPVRGTPLGAAMPFNSWHLALGASLWGVPAGRADWHFALVVSPPDRFQAGANDLISDFSYDRYRQWLWSVAVGCTIAW